MKDAAVNAPVHVAPVRTVVPLTNTSTEPPFHPSPQLSYILNVCGHGGPAATQGLQLPKQTTPNVVSAVAIVNTLLVYVAFPFVQGSLGSLDSLTSHPPTPSVSTANKYSAPPVIDLVTSQTPSPSASAIISPDPPQSQLPLKYGTAVVPYPD